MPWLLSELEHIFRFQTTETEDYKPTGELVYWTFAGQDKLEGRIAHKDMINLLMILEHYQFEGYRDRTPLFIKPEEDL